MKKSEIKDHLQKVIEETGEEVKYEAYPVDNSYAFLIYDPEDNPHLAGTWGEPAEMVKVISDPFMMEVEWFGMKNTHEFVIVKHQERYAVVLNNFTFEQRDYSLEDYEDLYEDLKEWKL